MNHTAIDVHQDADLGRVTAAAVAAEPTASVLPGRCESAAQTEPPELLLIDDEPIQLKILGRQFANLGLPQQARCSDAREAMALVEQAPGRFGLVACDLHMPEMDGVEVVRRLGELGFRGALLLISGEDTRVLQTAERLARAQSLHVLGAVRKPVPVAALRELLSLLLQTAAVGVAKPAPARTAAAPPITAAALANAIAQGELVVHYQPKVALDSGRLVGVEALVRWQRPFGELLSPENFIGLAEEHGLIDALTENVLALALAQVRRWADGALPLKVAVNVSTLSLVDHNFPDRVLAALQSAGVPAARLMLEITESCLIKQPVRTLDVLARLRLKRVGLSIDDFGTGHSSLTQLHDLPFNELKLDRRFVTDAYANVSQQAIVRPTLDMARQLGLYTVAEGVETLEDWRWLQASGCAAAQGFFIGRPMPADRLLGWLAEWETRRGALVG